MNKKKKVFITGASGFIGSVLIARLEASGYNVIPFSHNERFYNYKNYIVGDFLDKDKINTLITDLKPEVVFHLAADKFRTSSSITQLRNSLNVNLLGTLNIVEACLNSGSLEQFIFLGTCEEYGESITPFVEAQRENPASAYGFSKMTATHLLENLNKTKEFPATILRPSIAYGPGQSTDMFLTELIETLLKGKRFYMSSGQQIRDFVFVDDVVDACLLALDGNAVGRVVNIGSGQSMSLREVAILAAKTISDSAQALIQFGSLPYRDSEIMNYSIDISLAQSVLGWAPRTAFSDGILKTVDSYRQRKN
tara:strand:- start:331 stop:1257 length:927 start_codon:yes stop_codon:yes gene_type:complete